MVGTPPTIVPNLQISNSPQPKTGPKTLKVVADFTAAADYFADFTNNFSMGQIDGVQGAFIDNRNNNAQVIVTINGTGQVITIPPLTQGTYPILAPSPCQVDLACAGGTGVANFFFVNFPLIYFQWTAQGSGAIIVSDPILDATVVGGKVQVNDAALLALWNTVISGGVVNVSASVPGGTPTSRSTMTAAAASSSLMAANAARKYLLIKAPETADLWLNMLGGTAGIDATDCIKLTKGGQIYESGAYVIRSAITYYCATGSLELTAYEG